MVVMLGVRVGVSICIYINIFNRNSYITFTVRRILSFSDFSATDQGGAEAGGRRPPAHALLRATAVLRREGRLPSLDLRVSVAVPFAFECVTYV